MLFERGAAAWDAVAWGYTTLWHATLPPQPEGARVRYRIGAWTAAGAEVFADWPPVQDTAEQAAAAFFRGEPLPDSAARRSDAAGRFSAIRSTGWFRQTGRARP